MSAESATLAGRAAAEALMSDTCRIERPAGTSGVNQATGRNTPRWEPVYEGRCRYQMPVAQQEDRQTPGRQTTIQRFLVQIPTSVLGVRVGDRITATACALDAELVDRHFTVIALHHKSHATARRLTVEEVTG